MRKNIFFKNFFSLNRLIVLSLFFIFLYSQTSNAATPIEEPTIRLDRSKDIYFDQFLAYSYSLQLLQAKNKFNNHDLILGGSLQTDWQNWNGNRILLSPSGTYQSGSAFYLTEAIFDMMGNITPWLTGMLSIADIHIGRPQPNGNYYYFNHAFFMLGNLDKSPFYAIAGVNTIPFGVFSGTSVWNTPLTYDYFNPTIAPMVGVSYYKNGLGVNILKFSDTVNHQNHDVFSVYYNQALGKLTYGLGAGFLTELESNATGSPQRQVRAGNGAIPSGFSLGNVIDINAGVGYANFLLSAEYDKGTRRVGANGVSPHAIAVTLIYLRNIWGRDTNFGFSRSESFHLNGIPDPLKGGDGIPVAANGIKRTWALSASRSIFWNNLSLGFDFERTDIYDNKKSYTGTVELDAYL